MFIGNLHVFHIYFFCGGKFQLSVCKYIKPLCDAALCRSTPIHHTPDSYTKTRTTLFLLCTKSCIVWRKIGVWRSFCWKFAKRKSLKLLGTSRSFRLCYLKIGNLLLNWLHRGDRSRKAQSRAGASRAYRGHRCGCTPSCSTRTRDFGIYFFCSGPKKCRTLSGASAYSVNLPVPAGTKSWSVFFRGRLRPFALRVPAPSST